MVISIIVIALSVIFDQVTKFLAVRHLYGNEPVDVIDGVFRFSYVENRVEEYAFRYEGVILLPQCRLNGELSVGRKGLCPCGISLASHCYHREY